MKVIDRNLLILEVFDKRAMTREAKLQIQLARLSYTFSWGREFLRLEGILGNRLAGAAQVTIHTANTRERQERG